MDGMAFDVEGNLFVTLPGKGKDGQLVPANQIIKVDTNGKWSLLIDDPTGQKMDLPTNCAEYSDLKLSGSRVSSRSSQVASIVGFIDAVVACVASTPGSSPDSAFW